MRAAVRGVERGVWRLLAAIDALGDRAFGQRFNPLYQSGTIAIALYLVAFVTGLWLLLFYRVGTPWESVARLDADPWIGRWARGVHRYASDLAVIATLVHAARMFAQARSGGARALAWVSGCVLLGLLFVCGWTGYVMVWDAFGQQLAREGARLLDTLPFLSEPMSRAFTGEQPLPTAFFFLNLFAHIGVPLGMCVVFFLHVKRLARPVLLPPSPVTWALVGVLLLAAIVRPPVLGPAADPLHLPAEVTADLVFAFWVPVTIRMEAATALVGAVAIAAGVALVPPLLRRRSTARPPSVVDPDRCVGCDQCALDCPYGAIAMTERPDGRPYRLARVDPDLCVSCGICAGSCSPMGIGPPGRSGRDQVARAREFLGDARRRPGEMIVVCCAHGAGALGGVIAGRGAVPYPVDCAGNLHTSVIELLLRGGAGGVLVLACPPRDCWNREGARWARARIYDGREAELQDRVSRDRVALAHAGARERTLAEQAIDRFASRLSALGAPPAAMATADDARCEAAAADAP